MSAQNRPIGEPYIRLAGPNDLEEISALACRAFLNDPLFNYFGSCTQAVTEASSVDGQRRHSFLKFMTKLCMLLGGRITVMAIPAVTGGEKETLAAASMWLPPNKRASQAGIITLIRAGVIGTFMGWGMNGLHRLGEEYPEISHTAMERGYKAKGVKGSPDESWYLQIACTDPKHQGKGYMAKLIREAYTHAPSSIFTLEASTSSSRDRYAHLGFELLEDIVLGHTKVDASGLPTTDLKDAPGVTCYVMANWDVSK